MKDMTKTASRLSKLVKVLQIALEIGIVTCFVGLGILAAAWIFKLLPEQFGTGFENISIADFLELQVAPEYIPATSTIIRMSAIDIILTLVCLFVGRMSIKCIRNILQPMTLGQPFHNAVSTNLKKLAWYSIAYYLTENALTSLSTALSVNAYRLQELLISDKITGVTFQYEFDLTFLIFSAVLLLLSYIFRYGEELQQLSDETL